ncbi:MAG: adenylate/guanylate cyclase domain-containing protein [Treponema sp.]
MKNAFFKILLGSIPFCILSIILIFIALNTSTETSDSKYLNVVKGCVSIPKNTDDDIFWLSGEFYFTPNKFNSLKNHKAETYANIPGAFSESPLNSKFGYASYGVHIEGLNPQLRYAIRVGHALSSCSVVIDGKEVSHQGRVGRSYDEEDPGIKSSEALFRPHKDGSIDIIFNISNFNNRKGGLFSEIMLGDINKISKMFRSDLIFSGSIFIAIFSTSIFFFLLFFFYKQISFVIWFAFASFALAIRGIFFYPHVAQHIFPDMNWKLSFIIRYITFPVPIMFFTICLKEALHVCYKIPYLVILLVSALYSFCIVFLPPTVSSELINYYQYFVIFAFLYNIVILVKALILKRELTIWIFIAVGILMFAGCYDMLIGLGAVGGLYIIPIADFASIMLLSIMILYMYASSIKKIELLSVEMKEVNHSLIRFVPEEIIELFNKQSIKELEVGDNVELNLPILSVDIRSFTNTSEKLSPSDVFELLNKYFALVVPIISEYHGIIPKYLGDGFFALFPNGCASAIECAIKMQSMLKEHKIMIGQSVPLTVGIGIDLGDVLFGIIGNVKRMDNIVISASYHNAEDIQLFTKQYNSPILISSSVFDSLSEEDRYFVRPIQLVKNKKKNENLLYEVYASDDEELRLQKHNAQQYLVEAFNAIKNYNLQSSYEYFTKALSIFPNDPVANYYKKLFRKR